MEFGGEGEAAADLHYRQALQVASQSGRFSPARADSNFIGLPLIALRSWMTGLQGFLSLGIPDFREGFHLSPELLCGATWVSWRLTGFERSLLSAVVFAVLGEWRSVARHRRATGTNLISTRFRAVRWHAADQDVLRIHRIHRIHRIFGVDCGSQAAQASRVTLAMTCETAAGGVILPHLVHSVSAGSWCAADCEKSRLIEKIRLVFCPANPVDPSADRLR